MAKAIILGSTGLVGSYALEHLLNDNYFSEVTALVRRPLAIKHEKLSVIITDFKEIPNLEGEIIFSCLGTTKKKTPDAEVYRNIEIGIPVAVAQKLKNRGLKQFHYISAMGVGPKSFGSYSQNKWEAETRLSALSLPALFIYRPSLIYGPREDKRWLEDVSNGILSVFDPLFIGKLKKIKRIHAETIARAMIRNAKANQSGIQIFDSDIIQDLGKNFDASSSKQE